MNRRNVLIGLGGMAAGSGVLFGTGAFSSVTADRNVAINVEGDAAAYLGIEGHPDYTSTEPLGGEDVFFLEMADIGGEGGGLGVNQEAETEIENILTFTNQSANDITVAITEEPEQLAFTGTGGTLAPGESESADITIDTTSELEGHVDAIEGDITITATGSDVYDPDAVE